MTVFADSSALVKLYADERDAEAVRAHSSFVVSVLARVEVPAALWGKQRSGELSEADARLLSDAFAADWDAEDHGPFLPVTLSESVLAEAVALAARHGLRAYDAVQLATAVVARSAAGGLSSFLCFDTQLTAAAAREGWETPE